MDSFLDEVATYVAQKYGDDISDLKVVFPSHRGGTFFTQALRKRYTKPFWQPTYLSIDDLMCQVTGMRVSDNIPLITELYNVYSCYHKESIDGFYFWGDVLLSNFDIVDKYFIDADMLFKNISDLKDIENDFSYLTENQLEIIKTFWKNFDFKSAQTDEKQKFLTIWNTLLPIYHQYNQRLEQLGLAYTGMIYRKAAQMIKSGDAKPLLDSKYLVIGFNALSDSEKSLMRYLEKFKVAEFFWDYDSYYVENKSQEAGLFLRENLKMFSNNTFSPSHDNFAKKKSMRVVAAPSDAMQCKYVTMFLNDLIASGKTPGKETAIVLTDENLLLPTLYSIPKEIPNINITMGYPLRQTPAYSFVERLLELQSRKRETRGEKKFYHRDVVGLLTHPFVVQLGQRKVADVLHAIRGDQQIYVSQSFLSVGEPLLDAVFCWIDGVDDYCPYLVNVLTLVGKYAVIENNTAIEREIIGTIIENVYKVDNSLKKCSIDVTETVLLSLLRRVMQSTNIPFEGEPTCGVQVMGILETRSLDFENVLILSMNDETFPGKLTGALSFIPNNLRVAYGIPTPQHHEGVYAYYFYRLLQRATNVDMVYAAKSDDKRTGEPSRYIYQLDYESKHELEFKNILLGVNLSKSSSIVVEKNEKISAILDQFKLECGDRVLTPSSFYNYIECPLKFYFNTIAGIKELDEVVEGGVDPAVFGNIVHKAIELLYRPLIDKEDVANLIGELQKSDRVEQVVIQAANCEYIKDSMQQEELTGQIAIIKDIVVRYLKNNLLRYDAAQSDFRISELESWVSEPIEIEGVGKINFGGKIDRIDRLPSGWLRVVDYKTGKCVNKFDSIDGLFSDDPKLRNRSVFQVMLYALVLGDKFGTDVVPTLYALMDMNKSDFVAEIVDNDGVMVNPFSAFRTEFLQYLSQKVSELYGHTSFTQTENSDICGYCSYKEICNR